MPYPDTPASSSTQTWIGRALLIGALLVAFGVFLGDFERAFQDSENLLTFNHAAVANGADIQWKDIPQAFDHMAMEGDSRNRYISYYIFIVNLKLRMALWDFISPHPSLSTTWIIVLLSLWPLFLGLRNMFGTSAAWLGTALYAASPGFYTGLLMLFHPAKPLANLVLIVIFYLLSRYLPDLKRFTFKTDPNTTPPRLPWPLILWIWGVMTVAPFMDETTTFAYLIILIWYPQAFWASPGAWTAAIRYRVLRNWAALMMPVIMYPLLLKVVKLVNVARDVPELTLFGYLFRLFRQGHVAEKVMAGSLFHNIEALVSIHLLPITWLNGLRDTHFPITDNDLPPQGTPWLLLPILLIAFLIWRRIGHDTSAIIVRRTLVIIGTFSLFLFAVLMFHRSYIVPSGFYYGGPFSVLWTVLATGVVAAAIKSQTVWMRIITPSLVAWMMVAQWINTDHLQYHWQLHDQIKMSYTITSEAWTKRHPALLYKRPGSPRLTDEEMQTITQQAWQRWKETGKPFDESHPIHYQMLWLQDELSFKTRLASRK
ncbi:MAG: hypothetical protein HQL53_05795 [Magnetococcales bacterium]|nr:hypothetical protein [Magnetococcales bacterium]